METIISDFQYTTPRIKSFDYLADFDLEEKEFSINIQHQKKYEIVGKSEAKVELCLHIASIVETPIKIDCCIEASFRWKELSYESIQFMLSRTAPSILVSMMRPIIAMFTNSSGFPPFNLPMINFSQEPLEDFPQLKD